MYKFMQMVDVRVQGATSRRTGTGRRSTAFRTIYSSWYQVPILYTWADVDRPGRLKQRPVAEVLARRTSCASGPAPCGAGPAAWPGSSTSASALAARVDAGLCIAATKPASSCSVSSSSTCMVERLEHAIELSSGGHVAEVRHARCRDGFHAVIARDRVASRPRRRCPAAASARRVKSCGGIRAPPTSPTNAHDRRGSSRRGGTRGPACTGPRSPRRVSPPVSTRRFASGTGTNSPHSSRRPSSPP